MSSNDSHTLKTSISASTLIDEINSLVKSNKTIIPFNKEHFLCQSISTREDIVYLDLGNYNAVEEYSSQDQIISVQTGIKIKSLQNFLSKEGKCFPVAYYDDETSLLDIILSAETGALEQMWGGLSRHILGLDSVLSTGQLIKSGGKVVKNVSGYDLTRFLIGSYGYFALPIRAHLRLYILPPQRLTWLIHGEDWHQLLNLATLILSQHFSLSYMQLFNQILLKTPFLEKRFKSEKQFILALQVFGDSTTVNAAEQTIKEILVHSKSAYSLISESSEQDYALQELSQISWFTNKIAFPKIKKTKIVDLSIKHSALRSLLGDSKISSFPFVYKIMSNRLRFCVNSAMEQDILLAHLADFALLNNTILPVAYADDTYIRRVKNLGYDTNNGDHLVTIKRRLKTQFDPYNLFNPYVEL